MFHIIPSPLEQYVFNNDYDVGGFPMTEYIKHNNNRKKEILGGTATPLKPFNNCARLSELSIPIGLVSYSNQYIDSLPYLTNKHTNTNIDVIDENMFEHIFNTIAKIPIKKQRKDNITHKIKQKMHKTSKKIKGSAQI
jgi:hypothetical protein